LKNFSKYKKQSKANKTFHNENSLIFNLKTLIKSFPKPINSFPKILSTCTTYWVMVSIAASKADLFHILGNKIDKNLQIFE